ncbi:FkbM family methyltransferase [Chitinophaga agrisoli]|uniref:FkbM family methyltransferase n=1 Tax=Chitinophaga agrisoli TaxID=2607653 RepID=A0A5B2VLI3_9BACT|nr:FkbM family methyltransferase [Chitinophaga agrisoli]KAA2239182.1 FkbM family methyltransferase [Chitinophaga agrisoli]
MSLINTLKFIVEHPLNRGNKFGALARFVKWQIGARLMPYPIIYSFTTKSKLVVEKGMTSATGSVYCGLYEFNDMAFLLHVLRQEDLFIDVGANIGMYTILSAAHLGADTVAVEPIPATFSHLNRNIALNSIARRVRAFNIALGAEKGTVSITSHLGNANHIATADDDNIIEVEVDTLDHILADLFPAIMKIDVEGFETAVLAGADETLRKQSLKAIIIELNGLGARFGYDEDKVRALLNGHGFRPYTYDPFIRKLIASPASVKHNMIYIRDIPYVEQRIKTAEKVYLRNKLI